MNFPFHKLAFSGRYLLATSVIILGCVSCNRDATDSQVDQAPTGIVNQKPSERTEEQAALPQSSTAAANNPTQNKEAQTGSASREGSGSKQMAQAGVLHAATATAAAQITTSSDKEWDETRRRVMDPSNDGWDTELFAEHAGKQLKHLGKLLVSDNPLRHEDLAELLATDFSCTPLRPADRKKVFADRSVTVERPQQLTDATVHVGADDLMEAMESLTANLSGASNKQFKFKVFRVTPNEQHVDTTSLLEISGRTSSGAFQSSATWRCRWEPSSPNEEPRLLSIILVDYEEVKVRTKHEALFSDCTKSLFDDVPVYDKQFLHGIDYWRARLENYLGIFYDGLRGVAIGDVNGDGLDDVYFCEPGGLPNRLFLQTADGSLSDVSSQSGINFLDPTRIALFVDLDNDGDQDMVTPIDKQIQFFSNDGKGHFTRETTVPFDQETSLSLAAADYDQDGKVDVYTCHYHGEGEEEKNRTPAPLPYHDARSGGFNRLLRNEGNWDFRDVTSEVGLDHNNDRWSYAAVWDDFDNDGDLDVYVTNDFGRNNLYRQDKGVFKDVAGPAGAEDMNFGMSASFGDYNRDGWMDIYVSNMFSSAGGRITYQPEFQTDGTSEAIAAFQRMSAGSTLLENAGDGTFRDVSAPARVGVGRWAWGSIFADINNDGWEDILVANGFVTGHLPGDL